MDPDKRREIASRGGHSAQASGRGHKWSKEEAVEMGRKGGQIVHERGTAYEFDSTSGAAAARKRRLR